MARKKPSDDSATQNAIEAAALAFYQSWSVDAAAEFTGADPVAAERCVAQGKRLPYMPTPEQIREECRRFRETNPRRMLGPQIPAVAMPSYSVASDAVFVPAEVA